jgi:hypothetical protein
MSNEPFPPPFHERVAELVGAGVLACSGSIQLRDSAGLAPASPLSLPIRGAGTLINIQLWGYCKRAGRIRQSCWENKRNIRS